LRIGDRAAPREEQDERGAEMKSIHVTIDDWLLKQLDSDPDVKLFSRSEVLRRAIAEYLKTRGSKRIAESYQRGYADGGMRTEFRDWESQGVWPPR
jgi:metal-responsive CopG/Arc/MetJ family transcriptional regulator